MHAWARIAFAAFRAAGGLRFPLLRDGVTQNGKDLLPGVATFEHRAGHCLMRFGRRARTPALALVSRTTQGMMLLAQSFHPTKEP